MFQFSDGQTRRNKRTGEVQVFQNGQWVSPGANPYTIAVPQDPYVQQGRQLGVQKDALDIQDKRNDLSNAGTQARILEAQARLAEANARDAERKQGAAKQLTDDQQKFQAKIANLNALSGQIDRVESLYQNNVQGGWPNQISGRVPSLLRPENDQFNSAGAGLAEQGLAAFRVPGVGSQSDTELRQFVEANRPMASDSDLAIEEKLRQIRARVDATRQALNLPPAQQSRDGTQQLVGPGGNGNLEIASRTKTEDDPALAGVRQRYLQMLGSGAGYGTIVKYLRDVGVKDPAVFKSVAAQVNFRNKNPKIPVSQYSTEAIDDRTVPLTAMRRWQANLAQSAPGAYAINAGDVVSLGTLDNLTDNPTLTRAGMNAIRQQYPGASVAGQITGGMLGAAGLEAGLAKAGLGAARAAIGSDLLLGGGYGAGSADEGNRLLGALTGAAAARAGSYLGGKVVSGAGRTLTGTRDAATRYLAERGVPLTLGQIAGQGGRVGRAVKGMEDKLESIPYLGDAIRARRLEGYQSVNRQAFDEALSPINGTTGGKIAEQGVEAAFDQTTDAYRQALSGVTVNGNDTAFINSFTAASKRGLRLPGSVREEFEFVMKEHVTPRFDAQGNLSGDAFQDIRRALREERKAWAGKPRGADYGSVLKQVEKSLEGLVRRQAPEAVPLLNKADAAYRRAKVVQSAVSAAKNTSGVFTPAQLGTAAEANAKKYGGSATTSRPFFELQRSAQDILPPEVPNSGSADRALALGLLPSALGGAGYAAGFLDPTTAAGIAALGLPYTRAGGALTQKALINRPEILRNAGEQVIKRRRIGGLFGSGASIPLLPGY